MDIIYMTYCPEPDAESATGRPSNRRKEAEAAAALERLAVRLYEVMERLEPTLGLEWGDLTEHEKDFYRATVYALADNRNDLLLAARA